MSRIKFTEAEFYNADKDQWTTWQSLQRFLKVRRALERFIVPPDPEDRDALLHWETN
ncbi:MAG: hypothetical protein AB3N24_17405 [Leisingera sp.]